MQIILIDILVSQYRTIKVREKSRECHNHKPQPFPDPKRKRKPTNLNKHKPNKRKLKPYNDFSCIFILFGCLFLLNVIVWSDIEV